MFSFTSLALPLGYFGPAGPPLANQSPGMRPRDGLSGPARMANTSQPPQFGLPRWSSGFSRYLETLLRTVQWIVYMSAPARRCHCVLQSKKASESAQVQSSGHVVIPQGFEY